MKKRFCSAVIPAAGKGTRMGTDVCKQFLKLEGKEIIIYTLESFEHCDSIDEIILVTSKNFIDILEDLVQKYQISKVAKIVEGGKERQDSVYSGLQNVHSDTDIVLVHDGVRPFVTENDITCTIQEAVCSGASVLGVPAKDTIKICSANRDVTETPKRETLWLVQTPQTFQKDILMRGYEQAQKDGFYGTDEATLVERLGVKVKMVEGSYKNIKITTKEDLAIAKVLLAERKEKQS